MPVVLRRVADTQLNDAAIERTDSLQFRRR